MSAIPTSETSGSTEAVASAVSTFASTTGIAHQVRSARKTFRVVLSTSGDINTASNTAEQTVEARRIYPHVFDEATKTGEALTLIQKAIEDVRLAIDDFTDANLQSIGTRFSQIALLLKKAYGISHANDPFAAVISFVRRAILIFAPEDASLPQLNSLLVALKKLADNPLLSLDDATDLIDKLTDDGWDGQHEAVEKIVAMLLNEQENEMEGTIEAMKKLLANERAA